MPRLVPTAGGYPYDLTEAVRVGYARAAAAVDDGSAERALETWVRGSREAAEAR